MLRCNNAATADRNRRAVYQILRITCESTPSMASIAITGPTIETPAPPARVTFMDGLRALAIIGVVCTHSARLLDSAPSDDPLAVAWIANVLHNGTVVFLFVAGFLFAHLTKPGWSYPYYLKMKWERVLTPFLFASAVLLLMQVQLPALSPGLVAEVVLVRGAGPALWYIPFVLLIYLLAPAFRAFRDADAKYRLAILAASFVIGILVHRPELNIDKLQALAYFGFFYLAGIEASCRAPWLKRMVGGTMQLAVLAALLVLLAMTEGASIGYWGSYGEWFADRPLNIRYLTNTVMIACLCSACMVFPALNSGLMRQIADDSFGLFFVHNVVLLIAIRALGEIAVTGFYVLDLVLGSALVFSLSWLIVIAIRRVAGTYSRRLIGA
jgi:surface polysaccharide O-acyltransferase-like enzyme